MTQNEFLDKLRNALENELSGSAVQDNVAYYSSYIMEEMRKGRTEAEVVGELGDPWVIARSLIDVAENTAEARGGYEAKEASGRQSGGREYGAGAGSVHVFGFDSWWKKLLLVLGIIGVVLIVVAVIGGIFSLLMPLIMPIIVVMLVVRLIGRRR